MSFADMFASRLRQALDVSQEREIGVVSFFSFASGFLTGKYRGREDIQGNARPAQTALAWMLIRPGVTAPIEVHATARHGD